MVDPVKRPDILPDPTPRERALAAVDARLGDIDTDLVHRVRQVDEAPSAYLPDLAWERSVDVYDPAWPEPVRRAVIAAAPEVHRYKGSRHAVEVALAALDVSADIVEWWQAAPRAAPYTFHVTALARGRLYDGPVLDARVTRVLYTTIDRAKPLSRAFSLTVAAGFPGSLGLAPVAVAVSKVRAALHPSNFEAFSTGLGLAPVAVARVRVRVSMQASP